LIATSSSAGKKNPRFIETEGILPGSQDTITCPCPSQNSAPAHLFCFFKDHFRYFPIYAYASQVIAFLQVFLPKPSLFFSPICAIFPAHSFPCDHPNYILCGVQITKLLIMLLSPVSHYVPPLRSSKHLHSSKKHVAAVFSVYNAA
jgi:hypothetical protein